jgi:two-component system LytT family response regulator
MNTLLQNPPRTALYLRLYSHTEALPFTQLVRLQSDRNYTLIFLADGRQLLASKTLGSFEKKLPSSFLRVHRSHLINLDCISHLDRVRHSCILKDGQSIRVSNKHFKQVKDTLIDLILDKKSTHFKAEARSCN